MTTRRVAFRCDARAPVTMYGRAFGTLPMQLDGGNTQFRSTRIARVAPTRGEALGLSNVPKARPYMVAMGWSVVTHGGLTQCDGRPLRKCTDVPSARFQCNSTGVIHNSAAYASRGCHRHAMRRTASPTCQRHVRTWSRGVDMAHGLHTWSRGLAPARVPTGAV